MKENVFQQSGNEDWDEARWFEVWKVFSSHDWVYKKETDLRSEWCDNQNGLPVLISAISIA